jgi:tetratricopeptide (TPR) repeat protein
MADYNRVEPFRENYIHKGLEYSKMALSLLKPESSEYLGSVALYNLKLKDYPEAIDNFNKALINNKNLREIAINASSLGYIYTLTNEYDKAAIKIIDAAIADIQSSTKETVALRLLATLLYEKKQDIDRAYKYIKVALDDASVYNARHRKIEIGQILPIIEKERITTVEEQRNLLIWMFSLVFVLFVMFLVSTIIINKQLKKIKIARQTIEEQNTKLLNINAKLTETSSIKDKYIGNFFYNIYQNISNLEHIYRSANKKLTTKNYDELAKSFKQSDLEHKRENMYKSFDETFLNLFPNFIEEYEKLFTPEELEHSHKHTNSLNIEMRIFALIRLGVYESEKISKFLNYSVHTINTYKTKVKNKSWVQNEQFEARIMEIRSVKSI